MSTGIRKIRALFLVLFVTMIVSVLIFSNISHADSSDEDKIVALINLSDVTSNEEPFYSSLDGEWFIFPEMLLSPTEVHSYILRDYAGTIQLPSSFERQTGKTNTYATYATRLKIPKQYVGRTLAVHVPFQYSAYKLYVDRIEVASNGQVGSNKNSHQTEMAPRLGYMVPTTDEILLTLQVSSFEHIRGGIENTMFIGEANVVAQKFNTNIIWTLFVNGSICIMGLFMILFAWFRRQERVFFIFGLFCLCFSVRSFYGYPFYYTLTMLELPWIWGTRFEYIFTEASILTFIWLISEWYKEQFSRKVLVFITYFISALMVITLLTKPLFFQALYFNIFYLVIPLVGYMIVVIMKGFLTGSKKDIVNMVGLILVVAGSLNDYAMGQGWIESIILSLPAVGIYVVIHVILMSRSYAEKVLETETLNDSLIQLNATLDEKVNLRTEQLMKANELLEKQALIDGLTGIYNRHRFNEYIREAFQKSHEEGSSLSIILFDLDEFKKYNDHYGHIQGDYLLKQVVEIVAQYLPANSLFARFGGEEFVVVLPNMLLSEAYTIAEETRQGVEDAKLVHFKRVDGYATISVGVASMTGQTTFNSEVELIDAADQQLYRSKNAGRNITSSVEKIHYFDIQH
ncbi:sensor domain-containing diguanylate cyclase [Paenibacillus endoradicis]|uniref:sensor domain-containing diguanylate cyclase n=1 Tax=Paenibacillus endoradicis TaxID=2972487 RepID=UPI002159638A|nr:diguanylate cyclase [Paenibacillus endoradicis]MCR8659158.1 diguanylate cyclase [Paenibacillus endoradicis]